MRSALELRQLLTNACVLVAGLGFRAERGSNRSRAKILCPWHPDQRPSCCVYFGGDGTLHAHCFSCGAGGDALTLIAQVRGYDLREDFGDICREGERIAGLPTTVAPERFVASERGDSSEGLSVERYDAIASRLLALCPLDRAPRVADYLRNRGVLDEARAAGLGGLPSSGHALADVVAALLAEFPRGGLEDAGVLRTGRDAFDWPDWSLLVHWVGTDGAIACVQRRSIDARQPKYRFPLGRSPREPFGVHELVNTPVDFPVVIVEGALDALARRRIATLDGERLAVIGIASASTATRRLPIAALTGRTVYIGVDTDEAGEHAATEITASLWGRTANLHREVPHGAKDWGEALAMMLRTRTS